MAEPLMQVFFLYLLYIGVGVLIFWFVRNHVKKCIARVLLVCLIIAPFIFYIPIEVKTALFGSQFRDVYETGIDPELSVIYYKVFSISDKSAKLYIVEGENGQHKIGSYYWFFKENGKWNLDSYGQILWTTFGGSASEFSFPPYF